MSEEPDPERLSLLPRTTQLGSGEAKIGIQPIRLCHSFISLLYCAQEVLALETPLKSAAL
jgi:hypothetical protein